MTIASPPKQKCVVPLGQILATLERHRFITRPPSPSDLEPFISFLERLNEDLAQHVDGGGMRTHADPQTLLVDAPREAVARVTVTGDIVVGHAIYRWEPSVGRAEAAVAVHPEFRRLGLGENLMQALIATARANQVPRLEARVLVGNAPAVGLLRLLNFRPLSTEGPVEKWSLRLI